MSRRTVSDAARELEDLAQSLNPVAYRQLQAEVSQARAAAEAFANENASSRELEITEARADVLQELCTVRDSFEALRRDGEAGRLTGADYHRQWNDLNKRQRAAERTIARLADAAESIAVIEEDPIAYADRFYSSTPVHMPDFSF